jgi:hypothetical protein
MAGKIFINYRREQTQAEANYVASQLEKAFGEAGVFLDTIGLGGAVNWLEKLHEQVDACEAMIVLIGKDWTLATDTKGRRRLDDPDDTLVHEVARALRNRIPVLPVLIDGARMPDIEQLPKSLWVLTLQNAMRLNNDSFKQNSDSIIEALRQRLAERRLAEGRAVARRGHGSASWWLACAVAAMAIAAGVVAGPWTLTHLGLPFPGVNVTTIEAVRLIDERRMKQLKDANATRDTAVKEKQAAEQRLAAVVKERDELKTAYVDARGRLDSAEKQIATLRNELTELQGKPTPTTLPSCPGRSLWSHNGSTLYLIADQDKRAFHYSLPRPEIAAQGVQRGTLLFDGRRAGTRYEGTARHFSKKCGIRTYQVSGVVESERRIVLIGRATRIDFDTCDFVENFTDNLQFDFTGCE